MITEIDKKRFWAKVQKTEGCWIWTGAKQERGYGKMNIRRKNLYAHRLSWEIANGKTPKDQILHSCDNPPCVNPEHLREGTQKENIADQINRGRNFELRKTHCIHGHEFNEENTYKGNGKPQRTCRKCRVINGREFRNRLKKLYGNSPYNSRQRSLRHYKECYG